MTADYPSLHANWNYPTAIKAGPGRIAELPALCAAQGMRRPLLVTDPGLAPQPMVGLALQGCHEAGLEGALFSAIKSNPTGGNVEDGVRAYRQGGHDGVIAFGGGSALDAAKAIALLAGQSRPLWDFEDIGENYLRADAAAIAPVVAVPTTAGTGSEVGRASVITDEQAHVKRIIFHPRMLPGAVILDAELCAGLPAMLTAATGMDALSHNLEALCSPMHHPMAHGIAIEGIRLVQRYLPDAVRDGSDIEARHHMLVASSMGATAFQKGLGAMHALAHPLGALYDAHHGMLNAILMPYVLKANRAAIEHRIAALARYMDLPAASFDGFLQWVLDLRASIGIPHSLAEIGIPAGRCAEIGVMAAADGSAATNPIPYSPEQYAHILEHALAGTL
ncbi:iron-containing alcohol dehydrogenase [Candidimonas humi]|uniref:Iron-containing alcohol dehydrogenase n=1 Tax=Candidimonas humi TaxID=683355 RepID=A0ABV8P1T6_9BURK|nr:iron-containing alcohol dehydrogenase [Candidimonas humi]MBV6303879.1 iron-containing alcohol dehydrogenase [Candidimonas humi]